MEARHITLRFTKQAKTAMAEAIHEANGVEVMAIGEVDANRKVCEVTIHARGQKDQVLALTNRLKSGQVIIHNHPSGDLTPSNADIGVAGLLGENGVGFIIVNNSVDADRWVVEPHKKQKIPVDTDELLRIFEERIPKAISGYEARSGQVEMAKSVSDALSEGLVSCQEAGTGTGKSLAYLAPSALWGIANEVKVVISTYTKMLQAQLVSDDLPVLERAGIPVKYAVLQGRNNYLCRRKLDEAKEEDPSDAQLKSIAEWAKATSRGDRSDIAFSIDNNTWEKVASHRDETLRARCKHFDRCFYVKARRNASEATVLVVNHALLLSDLELKRLTGGDGILPSYTHVVIDEAHHLEAAATSLFQDRTTALAVRRVLGKLTGQRKKKGALHKIRDRYCDNSDALSNDDKAQLSIHLDLLDRLAAQLKTEVGQAFDQLAADGLSPEEPSFRVTETTSATELWEKLLEPTILRLAKSLGRLAKELGRLEGVLDNVPDKLVKLAPQPHFDIAVVRRRAVDLASLCHGVMNPDDETVAWLENSSQREPSAAISTAPISVSRRIRERLFNELEAVVMTSATLTVGNRFDHLLERVGLDEQESSELLDVVTDQHPSPFDYQKQGLLAIPRDIPIPSKPAFDKWATRFVVKAIEAAGGGAFVLCTSYAMIDTLYAGSVEGLNGQYSLFKQGEMGRAQLLRQFRETPNSVLFGTDSFWEGVSVTGDALRLVIIPKLPFRVPTDPVQQARHESAEAKGLDPFKVYSLPQAVLRLRQGVGRLIRTQRDRGVVVILDRRLVSHSYGRVFLSSLPPMRRLNAPSKAVLQGIHDFFE